MPYEFSGKPSALGRNIRRFRQEGKPQKQALAISLDIQRRAKEGKPLPSGAYKPGEEIVKPPKLKKEMLSFRSFLKAFAG